MENTRVAAPPAADRAAMEVGSVGRVAVATPDVGTPDSAGAATGATVATPTGLVSTLLPLMAVIFLVFLVVGLALPVLPLHVRDTLGFGTVVVGLLAGSRFAASFLSRFGAGHYSDRQGAKRTVIVGLLIAPVAGLLYLTSLRVGAQPVASVTLLLAGRFILGAAESFVVMGVMSWGIALAGPGNAGKALAWTGTAMYAAYTVGAPLGTWLFAVGGVLAVALATLVVPPLALVIAARVRPVAPQPQTAAPFRDVASAVWLPGLGLALGSVGYGALTAFVSLLFADRGWGSVWLAFSAASGAFIIGRIAFGHLPDRIGGGHVALVCTLTAAAGTGLIWLAPSAALVFVGAALTGLGYSLVHPAFGLEAVRRAPPERRGLVLGAYTAFYDVAMGLAGPALGLVASRAGLGSVFLVGTLAVLCAAPVAVRLQRARAAI